MHSYLIFYVEMERTGHWGERKGKEEKRGEGGRKWGVCRYDV
jgi:hypothetical protein